MVSDLRMDVSSVMRELEVALKVLTEARVMSRYRKVVRGKGLEFEDFREYTPQDDASEIDWKASARSGKLVIKRYREERDMNVFFAVDVSSTMLFGSGKKLKYEYAAELVAALSHFVLQSGDKAGLVMFSDKVVKYLEPGKGEKHFYILLKNLLTPKYYGGRFALGSAIEFMMNTTGEKSMLFVVSDFIGLEKGWERAVRVSSGKLDGVAVMVRDPRDRTLPAGTGQVVVEDPFSDRELLIDSNDHDRMEYERYVMAEEEKIRKSMKEGGWDLVEVSTSEDFVMPVIKFLKRREMLLR